MFVIGHTEIQANCLPLNNSILHNVGVTTSTLRHRNLLEFWFKILEFTPPQHSSQCSFKNYPQHISIAAILCMCFKGKCNMDCMDCNCKWSAYKKRLQIALVCGNGNSDFISLTNNVEKLFFHFTQLYFSRNGYDLSIHSQILHCCSVFNV